jgi:hypothetical protein
MGSRGTEERGRRAWKEDKRIRGQGRCRRVDK